MNCALLFEKYCYMYKSAIITFSRLDRKGHFCAIQFLQFCHEPFITFVQSTSFKGALCPSFFYLKIMSLKWVEKCPICSSLILDVCFWPSDLVSVLTMKTNIFDCMKCLSLITVKIVMDLSVGSFRESRRGGHRAGEPLVCSAPPGSGGSARQPHQSDRLQMPPQTLHGGRPRREAGTGGRLVKFTGTAVSKTLKHIWGMASFTGDSDVLANKESL